MAAGNTKPAPVVAGCEIEIEADAGSVWDVLIDIERWPSWNPDVRSVSIEGEPAEGTSFRWKSGPGTITSTIRRLDRPRQIVWTGRTMGIDAVHVWQLEGVDGHTVVKTEETFSGAPARLFRRSLTRKLARSLETGLERLKERAEGRNIS